MGLTREIGGFLADMRFERVPEDAVVTVCTGFTDCVGVMLAGLTEPVSPAAARAAGISFDVDALAILGAKGPAPDLGLIYGTAAHALDFDDTGLSGHPSAVLVPAILAEAADTGADGRKMIAAYVAGYEIWAELIRRDLDQHHKKGWHPTAMFGTLAAAGASAVLRGLDSAQASRAVAIAGSLAGGIVSNFGTMTKPFQVGRAVQSGLLAARLAEAGISAADDAIEHELGFLQAISPRGRVDSKSKSRLGTEWRILALGINVKLYPMCYAAHRSLDAMIDLRQAYQLAPSDIEEVEVELSATQATILRNHRPQNALDAKFSIEFAMAAAAISGRCSGSEFNKAFVRRPDVQDFFAKVKTRADAAPDPEEPSLSLHDRVHLSLRDGRRISSEPVRYARGHFKRPIESELLWQKFQNCAAGVIGIDQARQLFDAFQYLPRLRSIRDLAAQGARAALAR
ncbi:MAG: MmgE/PrpD family protein [Xanthobacteraceae bacterium]